MRRVRGSGLTVRGLWSSSLTHVHHVCWWCSRARIRLSPSHTRTHTCMPDTKPDTRGAPGRHRHTHTPQTHPHRHRRVLRRCCCTSSELHLIITFAQGRGILLLLLLLMRGDGLLHPSRAMATRGLMRAARHILGALPRPGTARPLEPMIRIASAAAHTPHPPVRFKHTARPSAICTCNLPFPEGTTSTTHSQLAGPDRTVTGGSMAWRPAGRLSEALVALVALVARKWDVHRDPLHQRRSRGRAFHAFHCPGSGPGIPPARFHHPSASF